jgi:replicative DNA helicase
VAARPSVGKTSFVLRLCKHVAETGRNAAFVSLEMSREQIGARLLSWEARVSTNKLERGLATDAEIARVIAAQEAMAALPLYIDDTSRTLVEIEAWCQRLKEELGGLAVLGLDYIQVLASDPQLARASRNEQVAAHSSGLKRLAKSLGLMVVAASQLSRAPEGRADKRPQLSDLRESGALEQDTDVAILLFRPEMHKATDDNQGLAEAIVAKNRTGPVGISRLVFIAEYAEFGNLAQGTF